MVFGLTGYARSNGSMRHRNSENPLRGCVHSAELSGMEANGRMVVAPLVPEDRIGIVETLHPVVDTPMGRRVIAVERMAGVASDLVQGTPHSLIDYEYPISCALSRFLYGN